MILGLAMTGDDLVGLVIGVLVTAYLVWTLIFTERL